jgi:hypothetical protein
MPFTDAENKALDRVVKRTATRISRAMDNMERDLPETVAPQLAIELVVRELAQMQPWFMRLIMEDRDIRESYEDATASIPAQPGGRRL